MTERPFSTRLPAGTPLKKDIGGAWQHVTLGKSIRVDLHRDWTFIHDDGHTYEVCRTYGPVTDDRGQPDAKDLAHTLLTVLDGVREHDYEDHFQLTPLEAAFMQNLVEASKAAWPDWAKTRLTGETE